MKPSPAPPAHPLRVPDVLRWCTDPCLTCDRAGHLLIRPLAVVASGDGSMVTLAYRCPAGHEWYCTWSTQYARAHAAGVAESAELRRLVWPPTTARQCQALTMKTHPFLNRNQGGHSS